jgi:rod shape determining protein RodA
MLVIFGIAMIRSAVAGNIELTQETNLVNRQLIFALGGFGFIFLMSAIDYHFWSSISRTLYILTIVALLTLNVIGNALFGSARWFRTAIIFIQPSELAKIVLIIVLADFFTRHIDDLSRISTILRSFLLAMGIVIWVILQPNLSTSIVMLVVWFAMLWGAGLRVRQLLLYGLVAIVILAITVPVLIRVNIIKDYQITRVTSFLKQDPNARYGDAYNLQQALISIGSGGWFGQGYGHGSQVQLRFLKVRWSDFIFSAAAQEFGFIGISILMLALIFVVIRCLRASRISRDTFGALIAYGVATMITFQMMVNIGVNLNLLPATGLTLPFVSYGGSSLFSSLIGVGLVQSIILRHRELEF